MNSVSYSIIYSACFALIVNRAAAQNVYTVGDSMGWTIPSNTSFYSNWTLGKTFMVGDILVFKFMTGKHNVVQVPKASYDNCSSNGAIGDVIKAGPVNVTLNSTGDRHYICSIGTHCQSGQKLSIRVLNSSSTPGGAAAPPPPMTNPPPTTPTTPLPPPPPPMSSSSVSMGGSFLIIAMSTALALIV